MEINSLINEYFIKPYPTPEIPHKIFSPNLIHSRGA
jgi:hypothetical protein